MLAKVRPRNIAGKTRRRAVVELIGHLELRAQKAAGKGLTEVLLATGTTLTYARHRTLGCAALLLLRPIS